MATIKKPDSQPSGLRAIRVPLADGPQSIETLKSRYEELRDARTTAAANLKSAESQLEKLKEQARTSYGTDDLTALKRKLDEMKLENERKRNEYHAALNKIETDLAEVETKYGQNTPTDEA